MSTSLKNSPLHSGNRADPRCSLEQTAGVCILALPHSSCVTFGKAPNLAVPVFLQLGNRDEDLSPCVGCEDSMTYYHQQNT